MHYADIWASGIVLYAMVYGTLPFDDANLAHLCKVGAYFLTILQSQI